jgi:hypothetical protein
VAILREKGASYASRQHIKDQYLLDAFDDIASQVQAVRRQGNFVAIGSPKPPSSPAGLAVSQTNGLLTVNILHPNAPAGTQWVLYYSTSPTFEKAIKNTLDHPVFQQYIPQQTLYFKVTAKFPSSNESHPAYLGNEVNPTSFATTKT